MTNTRQVERQGPPRLLVVLLAVYTVGLLLEVGAAFALARLSADGRTGCGGSRSESTDVVTPADPITQGDSGPPACASPMAARASADARVAP